VLERFDQQPHDIGLGRRLKIAGMAKSQREDSRQRVGLL